MAARAVRCFREQTYPNKMLFIWDSGTKGVDFRKPGCEPDDDAETPTAARGYLVWYPAGEKFQSIGKHRNDLNELVIDGGPVDIFVHWDDDDYSHPRRIEEQVALLVASGKECVGYNEMLFWDETELGVNGIGLTLPKEEAWLFQNKSPNYALGTSLCYWRSTWEKHPFPDKMRGEDYDFVYGCDSAGCSSIPSLRPEAQPGCEDFHEPRMIASIHADNGVRVAQRAPHHWTRAPQFEDYCREKMAL